MVLLKRTGLFSVSPGVSAAGGVMHNLGQIIVASFVMGTIKVFVYFPALILSGVISGTIIGILAYNSEETSISSQSHNISLWRDLCRPAQLFQILISSRVCSRLFSMPCTSYLVSGLLLISPFSDTSTFQLMRRLELRGRMQNQHGIRHVTQPLHGTETFAPFLFALSLPF